MKYIFDIGKVMCLGLYGATGKLAFDKKWKPLASIALLHFTEYFLVGRRTGKLRNKSNTYSFINTMLFGFTWWVPFNQKTHDMIDESKKNPEKFKDRGTGIRFVKD